MAKIDVTTIEGYADMTAEEKLAALEGYEMPDPDYKGWIKKDTFDKTASELAALKRQNRELVNQDEAKKTEAEKMLDEMKSQLDAMKKEKTVSEYTAKFIAQGYDEALASDTASALADGDTAKVFANQNQFLANYAKNLKAESLKKTPKPAEGGSADGGTMTREALKKMSPQARYEYSVQNPEEYKTLYNDGGNT